VHLSRQSVEARHCWGARWRSSNVEVGRLWRDGRRDLGTRFGRCGRIAIQTRPIEAGWRDRRRIDARRGGFARPGLIGSGGGRFGTPDQRRLERCFGNEPIEARSIGSRRIGSALVAIQ
jgi:hypothetical protein